MPLLFTILATYHWNQENWNHAITVTFFVRPLDVGPHVSSIFLISSSIFPIYVFACNCYEDNDGDGGNSRALLPRMGLRTMATAAPESFCRRRGRGRWRLPSLPTEDGRRSTTTADLEPSCHGWGHR